MSRRSLPCLTSPTFISVFLKGSNTSLRTAMSDPNTTSPFSILLGSPSLSMAVGSCRGMLLYLRRLKGLRPVSAYEQSLPLDSDTIFRRRSLMPTPTAYQAHEWPMMCRWSTFCVWPRYCRKSHRYMWALSRQRHCVLGRPVLALKFTTHASNADSLPYSASASF